MATIKMAPGGVSLAKMRTSVIVYGAVCCALYIVFLLIMKVAGLAHITELRFVNYVILFFIGMSEIKRWIRQEHTFVPFLQVIGAVFFTGLVSFFLFSIFLYVYTIYDAQMADLFSQSTHGYFREVPSIVILMEGAAASIIVAFINMQYFRRYEEGEKPID
jgi:hypothetical protein